LSINSVINVCVLAHNEEKNIEATLSAICDGADTNLIQVHVYANGCTDRTVEKADRLASKYGNIHVHSLDIASKPIAWNTAFRDQRSEFIVFADADIVPSNGAAMKLCQELQASPHSVAATCRQIPLYTALSFQQMFVGFMQMPVYQNFLAGGFYAVRRQALADIFSKLNLESLPIGVTGEDGFIDNIVGTERLLVSELSSAYRPPNLSDYCKYLARIRWQNEQIRMILKNQNIPGINRSIIGKLKKSKHHCRLFIGILASVCRYCFKAVANRIIIRHYNRLGPVSEDGAAILGNATRSSSSR